MTDTTQATLTHPGPAEGTRVTLSWNQDGMNTVFAGTVTVRYFVPFKGFQLPMVKVHCADGRTRYSMLNKVRPMDEVHAEALELNPQVTARSFKLFMDYVRDSGNWSGTPLVDGNVGGGKQGRGNLTQLKRAGLIATFRSNGDTWIEFTEAGIALAAQHGEIIFL